MKPLKTIFVERAPRLAYFVQPIYQFLKGDDFSADFPSSSLFYSAVRQDDIVLEAGANTGSLTMQFAKRALLVYAFEPSEHSYKILTRRMQGVKNVIAVHAALSDETGIKRLFIEWPTSGSNTLLNKGKVYRKVERVQSFTIPDTCISPTVISLDIEGSEVHVLETSSSVMHGVRVICVETHNTADRVRELLRAYGFKTQDVMDGGKMLWVIGTRTAFSHLVGL